MNERKRIVGIEPKNSHYVVDRPRRNGLIVESWDFNKGFSFTVPIVTTYYSTNYRYCGDSGLLTLGL